MPIDSAARLKLITSKSENFGTTPLRGIFPFSFTKSAENILHISRNLNLYNCQKIALNVHN